MFGFVMEASMQAPIYDDDNDPPRRSERDERSFTLWAVAGGVLVLLYILTLLLLRPA